MTPEELRSLARSQPHSATVGKVAGAAHTWMTIGGVLLALGIVGVVAAGVTALFSVGFALLLGVPALVVTIVGWKMYTTFA